MGLQGRITGRQTRALLYRTIYGIVHGRLRRRAENPHGIQRRYVKEPLIMCATKAMVHFLRKKGTRCQHTLHEEAIDRSNDKKEPCQTYDAGLDIH